MAERPILFSGAMVRAILDGRKTVTRRPVKPQPHHIEWFEHQRGWCAQPLAGGDYCMVPCPYGAPGDRLWVREQHSMLERDSSGTCGPVWYWADGEVPAGDWTRPRPSIHMPRWASRLTLEVVSVRVERLREMTVAEMDAEGIDLDEGQAADDFNAAEHAQIGGVPLGIYRTPELAAFAAGWDRLYRGKPEYRWEANPWVWRVEFKRLEGDRG